MKFNVVNHLEQESCQQRSGLCSAFKVFGSIRVGVEALGRALVQPYPRSTHALLPIVLACLLAGTLGRDPFDQNFWKFRSKTQWIGSVQPEKFRKNWSIFWGGPLFPVGILVEGIAPLVTVEDSVWADHPGFLSPCHGGCDLGKMVVVPSPLGHLTSTRNLGVNPRFHLLSLCKKDCFLLFWACQNYNFFTD